MTHRPSRLDSYAALFIKCKASEAPYVFFYSALRLKPEIWLTKKMTICQTYMHIKKDQILTRGANLQQTAMTILISKPVTVIGIHSN